MAIMSGAELCIALLKEAGITCISGIPGGCNLPIYDALAKSGLRHVLARHEQGAGFIAQGMARSSGKAAVFFATSGPGATNTLTALADARLDSIPIICITGQVGTSMIGTDAFQEVDIYGMSIPVTKHNFLVRSADELLEVIPQAFEIAEGGRPGPVLIDIPKDVQMEKIEVANLSAYRPKAFQAKGDIPVSQLLQAAALLNSAERPIMLVGAGAATPEASGLVRELLVSQNIPAALSMQGLGAVPHEHPLSLGMLGMHGARCTNMLLDECDLLLVVGSRLDDRATGRMDKFCPQAKVIHIDIDESEVEKLRPVSIGIVGAAALALRALLPLLKKPRREAWMERVASLKKSHPLRMPALGNPCSPYGIIKAVAGLVDDSAIIATDVGQHQMRTAQAYPLNRTRQWLSSGGLGTMGFGLPAALGAALQNPKATVLCFTGDGSLMMNIQELATTAEEQANVKIILCNNNALGLVVQQQELFYGGRLSASTYSHIVDFQKIAEGFGIPSIRLNDYDEPLAALKTAITQAGPCLIEVNVEAGDKVFPMVPPGAANSEMIGGEHEYD